MITTKITDLRAIIDECRSDYVNIIGEHVANYLCQRFQIFQDQFRLFLHKSKDKTNNFFVSRIQTMRIKDISDDLIHVAKKIIGVLDTLAFTMEEKLHVGTILEDKLTLVRQEFNPFQLFERPPTNADQDLQNQYNVLVNSANNFNSFADQTFKTWLSLFGIEN